LENFDETRAAMKFLPWLNAARVLLSASPPAILCWQVVPIVK
jgi:hypothetical protein